MNQQDRLVATIEHSDFPQEAKKLPTVGPYNKPNYEKLIMQKPTLILVPNEGPAEIQARLKEIKIPYKVIKMRKLEEIPEAAKEISSLLGDTKPGEKFYQDWQKKLASIKKALPQINPKNQPQVFIQIQNTPLIGVGKDTFLDDMIVFCGAQNILGCQPGYPKVARESILNREISHLFISEHFDSNPAKQNSIQVWRKFFPSSKTKIKTLDVDLMTRPGPRMLKAVETLCQELHQAS
jgi:ABC-type Fe3+-hydroxamate transport system substrate-binding protein